MARASHAAQYVLRGLLIACLVACSGPMSIPGDPCTPFGNPPAKVAHTYVPRWVPLHRPICWGGRIVGPWRDANGTDRYACLYTPARPHDHPLPLVVFLHGSIAPVDSIRQTGLLDAVDDADLGGQERGFILLAPAGRHTTHYYPIPDASALGWDNWYRQLAESGDVIAGGTSYPENADAAAIDHFIELEIAGGKVDPRRIYMMGWSNGGAMALLYALDRPRIAAAAIYSAPDPFGAFIDPCPQRPVARAPLSSAELQITNPRLAVMHVRNRCDIGGTCPNGNVLALELRAAGVRVDDEVLGAHGERATTCDDACGIAPTGRGRTVLGTLRGLWNHLHWPRAWNSRMFAFLRQHARE